jgi:hypothetical protein
MRELRAHQGRTGRPERDDKKKDASGPSPWINVDETTRVADTWHVGKKDEQRFRDNTDGFLDRVNVDTYVSKSGKRGLIVKGVDQQLANNYGVAIGDVLIEINGKRIESRAQAVSVGKDDYKRGVRTFTTKWMSNGQEITRTYQAPDK